MWGSDFTFNLHCFFFLFNPFFCLFLGEATKFGRNDSSSPAPPTSLSTAGVQSQPQQAPQAGTQGQGQGQNPAQQTQNQAFLNPPLPPGYGYTGKGTCFFLRKKMIEWITCHIYFLMGLAHLETGLNLFIFSLCSNIYCTSKCVRALNFKKYISASNKSSIRVFLFRNYMRQYVFVFFKYKNICMNSSYCFSTTAASQCAFFVMQLVDFIYLNWPSCRSALLYWSARGSLSLPVRPHRLCASCFGKAACNGPGQPLQSVPPTASAQLWAACIWHG